MIVGMLSGYTSLLIKFMSAVHNESQNAKSFKVQTQGSVRVRIIRRSHPRTILGGIPVRKAKRSIRKSVRSDAKEPSDSLRLPGH